MADSIHIARWLKQFEDSESEIHFFPSARYRRFTREFKALEGTSLRLINHAVLGNNIFSGYIDFLLYEIGNIFFRRNIRKHKLRKLISRNNYSVIHAIEIQHAGYLLLDAIQGRQNDSFVILTNWGSDLYFFANDTQHLARIKALLELADFYSAECNRDYAIASNLGFSGGLLPIIPNAGGFVIDDQFSSRTSSKTLILIKANGGTFGNIKMLLPLITESLSRYPQITAHFYSVTPDIQDEVVMVSELFPGRVTLTNITNRLSHEQMLQLFDRARIYISSSKSDGISTSFLEALVSGAYPIQSNTSCADEWVKLGFQASIIKNNPDDYRSALDAALSSDELVDFAQATNLKLVPQYLDEKIIGKIARNFYNIDFLREQVASESKGEE
jgi:glycosyltransferase involved in cell wall biosynthesis